MRFLLDTHMLIWLAFEPERLPATVLTDLEEETNAIFFSAVNIWEIAIKHGLGRTNFTAPPERMLDWANARNFGELAVTSAHAIASGALPNLHKDPFDRLLVAQAMVEEATLLTADKAVAEYPGPIRLV